LRTLKEERPVIPPRLAVQAGQIAQALLEAVAAIRQALLEAVAVIRQAVLRKKSRVWFSE
jgi:hypothetical protein